MTCDELRDYYELYALGIADTPEAAEISDHLGRNCQTCMAGLRGARELISLLGAATPPVQPPARLRRRIRAAVGDSPARWRNWSPAWAAVAAAAIILAVFFNARSRRASAELAQLQSQSVAQTRELTRLNAALDILNQPDARQVVFGGGAEMPPRGRVFLNEQRGVLLLASNLPPVPPGKTYEMWVIPKGRNPMPAGLFQSAPDGTAMHILSGWIDVAATGAIAVTLESAGGAPQPTSQPLIIAAL